MSPEDVLGKGRQTQKATPPTGNDGQARRKLGRSARGSGRGRGRAGLMDKFWVRQSARLHTAVNTLKV